MTVIQDIVIYAGNNEVLWFSIYDEITLIPRDITNTTARFYLYNDDTREVLVTKTITSFAVPVSGILTVPLLPVDTEDLISTVDYGFELTITDQSQNIYTATQGKVIVKGSNANDYL